MEKIIKNTIEDFTDDKEIIEIEKLMFDKKYEEAFKKMQIYANQRLDKLISLSPQQQEEESYKFYIIYILDIICMQYIDLSHAIYALKTFNEEYNYESLGMLLLFYNILQKMESGYYDKQNTKMAEEYIAKSEMTLGYLINKIAKRIQEIFQKEGCDRRRSKKDEVTAYIIKKYFKKKVYSPI